jgi:hypothetical protein
LATIHPSPRQKRLLSLFAQPGTGALPSMVGGEAVGSGKREAGSGKRDSVRLRGYLQAPWLADHGNEVRLTNEQMTRTGDYWTDLWVRSDECMAEWPGFPQPIG